MATVQKLSDIRSKDDVTIIDVQGNNSLKQRLQEIGFVPGTIISLFSRIALGGPLACHCRGAKIALRRKDAESILVSATA